MKADADHAALEKQIRAEEGEAGPATVEISNDGDFMILRQTGLKLPEAGSEELTKRFAEVLAATIDHRHAEYRRPTLILMGNEQAGLPPELADACDVNVKIPMRGRADSLNLSVATGIMIYAAT